MRLSLSLLFMVVFASGALAREAPDVTDETCALFAAVLEWPFRSSREIFVNDRLFHDARRDYGDGAVGNYIRKRRPERRPVFYLPENIKIVGPALVKTWSAFDRAAPNGADQRMPCAPEDFAPTSVAVFSLKSGMVRYGGGVQESLSGESDYSRESHRPSPRLGNEWVFSQPGVSADGLESVVRSYSLCGGQCGIGFYYLLRREERGAHWRVVGVSLDRLF